MLNDLRGNVYPAVSSCLYINEVSRNAVLWQRVFGHADFALMFWSTTAATSIYLTIGIIAKIQYMRRQLHKVRGGECYSPFLSTTAAVVESGLLSTIFQICMLAAYARDNTVNLIFLGVTVQTNVCRYQRLLCATRLMPISFSSLSRCYSSSSEWLKTVHGRYRRGEG